MIQKSALDLSHLPTAAILEAFFHLAVENNYALALWRLPRKKNIQIAISMADTIPQIKVNFDELMPGFAFSPFHQPTGNYSYFIKADIYCCSEDKKISLSPDSDVSHKQENFVRKAIKYLESSTNKKNDTHTVAGGIVKSTTKEAYIKLVKQAIEQIKAAYFKKVVLSKVKLIHLKDNFDIVNTYLSLCEAYPGAFSSVVVIPGVGTWLGATPERLLAVDENNIFSTVALAGTQKREPDTRLIDVPWTQKEIEEQAMVSRYIINCFKKIRLREFEEEGPQTVSAGDLVHLQTKFWVDKAALAFPSLETVMLELLHPTSAVCGLPKAPAMEFILKNEGFDRSFFSGFLGPVQMDNASELYVNLRCMQLLDKHKALLYAGAGITAYSDPEKEWLETEMKYKTILAIIQESLL